MDEVARPRGPSYAETMVRFINVPFNSAGIAGGVANMPAALGFEGVEIAVRATPVRGPFGFLAEDALVTMVADVAVAVTDAERDGETPIVIGGDCPVMLGALAALRPVGLVFIDGHEDAWQPTAELSGEAADSELGIALGLVPAPIPPVLDAGRVVVLGPRDSAEIEQLGQRRIDGVVALRGAEWVEAASLDEVREVVGPATASNWWLHVDLDVLSSDALSAVDYPQPGGLGWARLDAVTDTVLAISGCRGASIAIYNPDLDAGATAPRVREYVSRVAALLD